MNEKTEILPCPICGSKPKHDHQDYWVCDGNVEDHSIAGPDEDPSGEGWNAMVRRLTHITNGNQVCGCGEVAMFQHGDMVICENCIHAVSDDIRRRKGNRHMLRYLLQFKEVGEEESRKDNAS